MIAECLSRRVCVVAFVLLFDVTLCVVGVLMCCACNILATENDRRPVRQESERGNDGGKGGRQHE